MVVFFLELCYEEEINVHDLKYYCEQYIDKEEDEVESRRVRSSRF